MAGNDARKGVRSGRWLAPDSTCYFVNLSEATHPLVKRQSVLELSCTAPGLGMMPKPWTPLSHESTHAINRIQPAKCGELNSVSVGATMS
jgi:hypothetical protein